MSENRLDNETLFMDWLSKRVPQTKLSELYTVFQEIEKEAKIKKLISSSLYENIDLKVYKRIKKHMEQNRIFKFEHRQDIWNMNIALNYLLQYAREPNKNSKSQVSVQEKVIAQSQKKEIDELPINRNDEQDIKIVDFNDINSMVFTNPVSLTYFGDRVEESVWKTLYVDLCRRLLADYPSIFMQMRDDSIKEIGKTWLVDKKHIDMIAVPKQVAPDYYVETNRNALNLVQNMRWILDQCSVDYENVKIHYRVKKDRGQPSTIENSRLLNERRETPKAGVYDRFGFDKYGYNKDGYDRMGYNREGYDRDGFDRNGLNQQGVNKLTGFDKDGFGLDGFNKEGYDREGYDREGFDIRGYNRNGYDQEGYNYDGFDKKGYDKAGYNKYGFDIKGYDKDGYNAFGLNRDGYNRQGYNEEGYDQEGFNQEGYDKDGFDRNGYDRNGYGRDGFNSDGRNRGGYDREGFDIYGFTSEGINKNGFNIFGISEKGINVLGYFPDGFDLDGRSVDGFSKDLFDEEGYHIYTGFNLKGFDREGFNINGVDIEGYDREGYGQSGYNRRGYNREGYDKDGFDEEGYDIEGYDHEGYNRKGYDRNGYSNMPNLLVMPQENKENIKEVNFEDNRREAEFFKKCEKHIERHYKEQARREVMKDHAPVKRTYIDRWGFVQTDTNFFELRGLEREINSRFRAAMREPYFCHVDYREDDELYLGKQAVYGWITDWADKRASLYYQYQMYIGDEKTGLNIVRDIKFFNSKYSGYKDLYNKTRSNEEAVRVADTHLLQIIEANKKNKRIHDIIESIQQNQYRIITSSKDRSSLVLGCAGSGKTMILMHKIRYMKYNHQDLNMDDIIVISPTDILGRESRELSRLLQVERIQQFTTASFYEKSCKDMLMRWNIPFEEFHIFDDGKIIKENYQEEMIIKLESGVFEKMKNDNKGREFIDGEQIIIDELLNRHISISGLERESIPFMNDLYVDSVKEIQKAGKRDIERLIKRIDTEIEKRELWEHMQDFVRFLQNGNVFKMLAHEGPKNKSDIENLFFHTKKAVDAMDYKEFLRMRRYREIVLESPVQCTQVIQLFREEKLDLAGIHEILEDWEEITSKDAEIYITLIDEKLEGIDRIERKRRVLQHLLENDLVEYRIEENNSLRFDTSFEKLLTLFDQTEEILSPAGYTPISYFAKYEKIIHKQKRLLDQQKNPKEKSYLFDTILSELEIEFRIDSEIAVPLSKAFDMAYLLYIHTGKSGWRKEYIFIDEFQDFSAIELKLIKNMYPDSVINLFGDVKQCINVKGISDISAIPSELYDDKPEFINENYRNARQITEYVNQTYEMNMLPVGLDGIQCTVENIPEIRISEDDRVAIIVANQDISMNEYKKSVEMNFYVDSRQIVRGIYNVIPISLAKGLEFEKVIVFQKGMTENEFYVACTRAITELYVIPERLEEKVLKEVDGIAHDLEEDIQGKKEDRREAFKPNCNQDIEDFHNYTLIVYKGNLKRKVIADMRHTKYISIFENNKEKKIPVDYVKETKQVYILRDIYMHHKKALEQYFDCSKDETIEKKSKTDL